MENLVSHRIVMVAVGEDHDTKTVKAQRLSQTPLQETENIKEMHPKYWSEADTLKTRRPMSAKTNQSRYANQSEMPSYDESSSHDATVSTTRRRPQSARVVRDVATYFSEAAEERNREAARRLPKKNLSGIGGVPVSTEEAAQVFAGVGNANQGAPPAYPFDPSQRPFSANRNVPKPPSSIPKVGNKDIHTAANAFIPSSAASKPNLLLTYAKAATRPTRGVTTNSYLSDFADEELEVMAKLLGKSGAPYAASSWRGGDQYVGGIDHRIMKVPDFRTMSPRNTPKHQATTLEKAVISAKSNQAPIAVQMESESDKRQDVSSAVRHIRGLSMNKMSSRPQSAHTRPTTPHFQSPQNVNTLIAEGIYEISSSSSSSHDEMANLKQFNQTAVYPSVPRPPSAPYQKVPKSIHRGSTVSSMARIAVAHSQRQRQTSQHAPVASNSSPSSTMPSPIRTLNAEDQGTIPHPPPIPRAQIIYDYSAYAPAPATNGPPPTIMNNDYGIRKHVPSVDLGRQSPRAQARFAANIGPPPSIVRTHDIISSAIGYSGSISNYFGMRGNDAGKQPSNKSTAVAKQKTIRAQPADDEEVLAQLLCDEPDRRYVLSDLGETRVRARAALRAHYRHRPYTLPSRYDDGGIAATREAPIYSQREHPQHRYGSETAKRTKGVDISSVRYTSPVSQSPHRSPRDLPAASTLKNAETSSMPERSLKNETGWRLRSVFDAYGPR